MTVIIIIIGGSKGEEHQEGIDIKGQEPNENRHHDYDINNDIVHHISHRLRHFTHTLESRMDHLAILSLPTLPPTHPILLALL